MMKHIHIIGTGGTISALGQSGRATDYQSGQIQVEDIIASLPTLPKDIHLTHDQFMNIGSEHMRTTDWIKLAQMIHKMATHSSVDGFVITHGTDTMEEASFFLSLVLNIKQPIVFCGAMRPANAISADGLMNLYQAIQVAYAIPQNGVTLFVHNDFIYDPCYLYKKHTYRLEAFSTVVGQAIGSVRDDDVYLFYPPKQLTLINPTCIHHISHLPEVALLTYYVDAPNYLIEEVLNRSKGLVIAGVGSGNMSKAWEDMIMERSDDYPIIRASRIDEGGVYPTEFDDKYRTLPAGPLTAQKARILLALLLADHKNNFSPKIWKELLSNF